MNLNLLKPVIFFDLETTGVDKSKDRIVEISLLKIYPDNNRESHTYLINPEMSIPMEATEIHGISNEDVITSPKFFELSETISNFIADSDLAGFNIDNFDLPILLRQLQECGYTISIDTRFIDVYKIYINKEPRTLSAAYKYYVGGDLESAHSAEADTNGTYEVLESMLNKYSDLESDVVSLSSFSTFDITKLVDFSGKLTKNENDEIVYNFGKHKGKKVSDHADYAQWMINNDFPTDTKNILRKIIGQ